MDQLMRVCPRIPLGCIYGPAHVGVSIITTAVSGVSLYFPRSEGVHGATFLNEGLLASCPLLHLSMVELAASSSIITTSSWVNLFFVVNLSIWLELALTQFFCKAPMRSKIKTFFTICRSSIESVFDIKNVAYYDQVYRIIGLHYIAAMAALNFLLTSSSKPHIDTRSPHVVVSFVSLLDTLDSRQALMIGGGVVNFISS
ncbi:hypothetical protein CRG98_036123 [Punica granatum]|uniref:Uncharacterized protein n=1 Tax=Punica granatum TaxID=22663 RepID=A0A2I0IHL9_PUNGR|nr:hypothetical protein CRG98_036123 [Punica granatum]